MTWFYTLCVTAIAILIADANGTLEPTVKKWEQKLGIPVYYAPEDSVDMEMDNPYPIEDIPQQDTFNNQRESDENNT